MDKSYSITYTVNIDPELLKDKFTEDEKELLRPIAETLAILDGNAFFQFSSTQYPKWYEQYLPEAYYLYTHCGGRSPYASWNQDRNHPNPAVREAWENYQLVKKLAKEKE